MHTHATLHRPAISRLLGRAGRAVTHSAGASLLAAAIVLAVPTASPARQAQDDAAARQAEAERRQREQEAKDAEKKPQEKEAERRAREDPNRPDTGRPTRSTGRTTGAAPAGAEANRFAPPAPTAGKPAPPQPAAAGGQPAAVPPAQIQPQPATTPQPGAPRPGNAAGALPAAAQAQPAIGDAQKPTDIGGLKGDYYTFPSFSEAVDLTVLVDFVQAQFDLQILKTDAGLKGQTVVLTTPVTVHKDDVLRFLVMLLEMRGYTMVRDSSGIYILQPANQVAPGIAQGDLSPTRIIPTPGIRPSNLSQIIQGLITNARGTGAPATPSSIAFLDDLGVIVVNDAPRVTKIIENFVSMVVTERQRVTYHRIPVVNIAASSARDRILELLGVATRGGGAQPAAQPGQPAQPQQIVASAGGSFSNITDRLTIDASSNALFFRGREDEKDQVTDLLRLVDVTSDMITRWYPVGNATAEAVAAEGRRLQLGDSTEFTPADTAGNPSSRRSTVGAPAGAAPGAQAAGSVDLAGSGFVLYPESGGFVYRGTAEQHARVGRLVEQLRDLSKSEEVVYEFYKLKHGKSTEISQVLQDLISSTASAGRSSLIGANLGAGSTRNNRSGRTGITSRNRDRTNQPASTTPNTPAAGAGESSVGDIAGEDIFVTADEPNNQIVVKAPLKLQPQVKRLIDKLDLRRPQVYIEATIVAISDSENFRLAAEAQGIIGQYVFNTNFGLGSLTTTSGGTTPTTSGDFTSPKNVSTTLAGLTTAIIKSKYVPFVLTALQNNTKAKIIAVPQLLVDDNVEAEVSSEDQQPTTTTSTGTATTNTSFSGFESAGPRLTVTPQISEGGYMKLEYEIELSSFQGDPQSPGVPPAKQKNLISAESVTVPSDATIVVGGLTQKANQDIVIKVPLLGDLPLIGWAFRDTRRNDRTITFFVFITPKIMRDPNFDDIRLNSQGPLKSVDIHDGWPAPEPESMGSLDPRWSLPDTPVVREGYSHPAYPPAHSNLPPASPAPQEAPAAPPSAQPGAPVTPPRQGTQPAPAEPESALPDPDATDPDGPAVSIEESPAPPASQPPK